ncbi:MAG TPA: MazG family protein [Acidimicrobiales bacterium]|nr:MazG family protein [Acidimicrobiales bacterium]
MARRRPHVTVVGLGPAGADLIPAGNVALLDGAGRRAFLRTARHPAAARFARTRSFDDLYESASSFDEVYAGIVERLVEAATAAAPDPVVYAVPGSPQVAERTVELLRSDDRVDVDVRPAPSFLDLAWCALGIDPVDAGVRLVDAAAFGRLPADDRGPFLVAQCWSRRLLSEVKLSAADDAPALARPVLLHHLGLEDEVVAEVGWWELDRTLEPDHLTSLFVPARPLPAGAPADRSAGEAVARLAALMDTLRQQCPWDRAQTHASLMPHLVEECYEVLDALEGLTSGTSADAEGAHDEQRDDAEAAAHLEEELGDLLFQIVFHARLADEEGRFDLADVARGVHDKLVRRHPHVFGDVDVHGAEQVVINWEAIKKEEKGRHSVTEGIPSGLPALMLATKLARKAKAVGLDPSAPIDEAAPAALAALTARAWANEAGPDAPLASDADETARAVGELLFFVATLAQRLGIDAEQALRRRAVLLRDDIRAAEGVPDHQVGNR